jgi:hypothetical protein
LATWWELAIPAGVGVVSGWGAAWLQTRGTLKVAENHAKDAARARQEQYEREASLRDIDERRSLYAELQSSALACDQIFGIWKFRLNTVLRLRKAGSAASADEVERANTQLGEAIWGGRRGNHPPSGGV